MKGSASGLPYQARGRAAAGLAAAGAVFPDLQPAEIVTQGLSVRDARLAVAIYRIGLQRWLTLEYLLNRHLKQPLRCLEPTLQGVLLSGAAQLVFMDRVPAHAVVDESVKLARVMVRAGAGGLVNAVLRRLGEEVEGVVDQERWVPGNDRLPIESGYVKLGGGLLPDPGSVEEHLSVATSHPRWLIKRWVKGLGVKKATEICLHGVQTPPVIVAVEEGFEDSFGGSGKGLWERHCQAGFMVWRGVKQQELVSWLSGHSARRVQDPTAAKAVEATKGLTLKCVVDLCAGRGTKAGQVAAMHRGAKVVASDTHGDRFTVLRDSFSGHQKVTVVEPKGVEAACCDGVDLVLLDVPCSNTGVLGRRLEARYRINHVGLKSLVGLQRKIMAKAVGLVGARGYVLYTTCSLEHEENEDQARWLINEYGMELVEESRILPGGRGASYHGGGYHALVRAR